MKTLNHGDFIRLSSWVRPFYAHFGTVRGYALKNNQDAIRLKSGWAKADEEAVEEAVDRAKELGHEMVWANYTGSAIVNDPSGQYYANEDAKYRGATVLEHSEEVLVEGVIYRVEVIGDNWGQWPKNSDPLKFVYVRDHMEETEDSSEISLEDKVAIQGHLAAALAILDKYVPDDDEEGTHPATSAYASITDAGDILGLNT